MVELLLLAPLVLVVVVMALCLALRAAALQPQDRQHLQRQLWRGLGSAALVATVCASLLALSGCGTARSRAPLCPPVPADLLTPPTPPVLLQPNTPSTTPGATTSRTPAAASWTGST